MVGWNVGDKWAGPSKSSNNLFKKDIKLKSDKTLVKKLKETKKVRKKIVISKLDTDKLDFGR